MFVAMMLMATSVWAAGTVIVTKKLNGTVNADAGTVEYNVSETDNVCTLTVTPASGNYVTSAFISAERIVEAVVAQGRRAIGMDGNGIEVEAVDETNPAGTTTYSFVLPDDETYGVEVTVNFQSRTDISEGTLTLSIPETGYSYDGQAKKPAVTVMLGGVELASTNYTVSYRDSVDAGQATVVVTGIKSCMGSLTEYFTIAKAEINDDLVQLIIDGWTYGDEPNEPSVEGAPEGAVVTYTYLYFTDDGMVESETAPINAGGYGIRANISETANYNEGAVENEFSIEQADFSLVTIADIDDQTYTGEAIEPALTVTFKGQAVDAADYTAIYSNNQEVGEATVTLFTTDMNFAAGDTNPTKTFQIVSTEAVITVQDQTVTYNGQEQAFTNYTVSQGSVAIAYYASEEDLAAGNNKLEVVVDAGTYYVKVTQADGNYTSEPATATFTIEPKSIEGMLWSEAEEIYVYDGQAKTLDSGSFGLYDEERKTDLILNDDYTVGYTNNTNVGTATVTIEGIGNYQGTATMTFEIVRVLNLYFGTDNMNTYATYCAAEDLETPEGLQAYVVTAINGNTLETEAIDYIPQGVPVLLEKPEGYYMEYAYAYTEEPATIEVNLLYGCATPTTVASLTNESTNIYVLYNDEFVKTISGTIPAFRCYLPVAKSQNASTRLSISSYNEATGISSLTPGPSPKGDGSIYSLDGRKLTGQPTQKGVYIMSGKKVVIK